MITITERTEAIVKDIGNIKTAKGLEEYFQSLSFAERTNALIKRLIDKRKTMLNNAIQNN